MRHLLATAIVLSGAIVVAAQRSNAEPLVASFNTAVASCSLDACQRGAARALTDHGLNVGYVDILGGATDTTGDFVVVRGTRLNSSGRVALIVDVSCAEVGSGFALAASAVSETGLMSVLQGTKVNVSRAILDLLDPLSEAAESEPCPDEQSTVTEECVSEAGRVQNLEGTQRMIDYCRGLGERVAASAQSLWTAEERLTGAQAEACGLGQVRQWGDASLCGITNNCLRLGRDARNERHEDLEARVADLESIASACGQM